jgi:hypothetical protein
MQVVNPGIDMQTGKLKKWVFRFWLCPWHRGAWNRNCLPGQKKLKVLKFIPDKELLNGPD